MAELKEYKRKRDPKKTPDRLGARPLDQRHLRRLIEAAPPIESADVMSAGSVARGF